MAIDRLEGSIFGRGGPHDQTASPAELEAWRREIQDGLGKERGPKTDLIRPVGQTAISLRLLQEAPVATKEN